MGCSETLQDKMKSKDCLTIYIYTDQCRKATSCLQAMGPLTGRGAKTDS